MSTRYVWGKFIRDTVTVSFSGTAGHYTYAGDAIYACSSYSAYVDKSTGLIKYTPAGNVHQFSLSASEWVPVSTYPYVIIQSDGSRDYIMRYSTRAQYWACHYATATGRYVVEPAMANGQTDNTTPSSSSIVGTDTINEVSQGKLSSNTANTYPNGAYQGDYYYKYLGSDSIDPTAISYPSAATAGAKISIKVTASTSNKFGGTVTYLYEYSKDEGAWDTTWYSGTSTSISATLSGSGTYRFRVRAQDNMGFTSTTYVTGVVGTITPDYVVSLDASPTNGGAISGEGIYSSGTSVTVKATPANGWEFVGWTENGVTVSTSASYTFTITASRDLTAVFKQKLTAWVGVNGKARKGVELYVGVNGKARKVTAAYIGVNGKARRFL